MLGKKKSVWKITDINKFIIAMDTFLCEKCDYGENIDKLSETEKVFYFNQTLEKEVNNGGYSQFFFNTSGNFTYEILNSLLEINANKTADIHKRAIGAFGYYFPKDCDERQEVIANLSDEVERILRECDNEFYKYQDNLNELNYKYIQQNKGLFTCN